MVQFLLLQIYDEHPCENLIVGYISGSGSAGQHVWSFLMAYDVYYQIALESWCWLSLPPAVNGSAHFLTCWQCLTQYYHSEKSFPLTCLSVFKCVDSVHGLWGCLSYSFVIAQTFSLLESNIAEESCVAAHRNSSEDKVDGKGFLMKEGRG